MSNNKPNKASMKSVAVGYVDSNGNFQYAKSDSPLPINISAAIGAFTTPWKLNYQDVVVDTYSIPTPLNIISLENPEKMFDNDLTTYAYARTYVSLDRYFKITPNIPVNATTLVILVDDDTVFDVIDVRIRYDDGVIDSPPIISRFALNPAGNTMYGAVIPLNRNKRLSEITMTTDTDKEYKIYGFYIYIIPQDAENLMVTKQYKRKYITGHEISYKYSSVHGLLLSNYPALNPPSGILSALFDDSFDTSLINDGSTLNPYFEIQFKTPKVISGIAMIGGNSGQLIGTVITAFNYKTQTSEVIFQDAKDYARGTLYVQFEPIVTDLIKVEFVTGSVQPRGAIEIVYLMIEEGERNYLYDSSGNIVNPASEDTLSAISGNIDTTLSSRASETTLSAIKSDIEETAINEVKLDPWYTGTVTDGLAIAATAKGTTPDITASYSFPATDSAGTTLYGTGAVIQIKKFAGRVILNFSNSDTAAAHTAYYEVDLDGVAYTGSVSVPASGTASATINIEQADPSDGDLTVDIYVWADTANVVTLTSHNIFVGAGTYSTSEDEVIAINREGIQVIAASFGILDTTYNYTWVMRSQTSNVRLNYLQNDDLYASDILPKTVINMYVTGSYAYVTGVTSIRRVM